MQGQLEHIDGRWQLRFTRKLAHPPEKVWRALTEPAHLAAWFPTDIEGARTSRSRGAAVRQSCRPPSARWSTGDRCRPCAHGPAARWR
ncbi:MAG TPA: SRPBCC domain-containing protein [Chloroflexota bacterium]|nr:SRPBCC domain-containing protein [Chloroflexota bacterium]